MSPRFKLASKAVVLGLVLTTTMAGPVSAHRLAPPPCTDDAYMTLDVPGDLQAIICSGDRLRRFEFQGIPDGIGAVGLTPETVDVFVNHEESEVPFPAPPAADAQADFQDSTVSRLRLSRLTGAIVSAEVAIPSSAGFMRFCSASLAGPEQGIPRYTFFTGEETNDVVDVPPGAPYGPDPSVAPNRQGGYAAVYDVATGQYEEVAGMGRHNHENTLLIPGGWSELNLLSTDDTFTATTSQLYTYIADDLDAVWADQGSLWAFQVTATEAGRVDRFDPFNEANDYLDIQPGDDWKGRFIKVPGRIARGETGEQPQTALENWSNEKNVFQFVRLEDMAYDLANPRTVWVADTGATRVVHNPATGRMHRPSGVTGQADNGRIFQFVFSEENPTVVDSFSVLADGDADPSDPTFVPMTAPDNMDTSAGSLMVQEDVPSGFESRIWRMDLSTGDWTQVAHVNVVGWESSGIIDASQWFGPGAWLLDVQAHGEQFWVDHEHPTASRPWFLRQEAGQLLLMKIAAT